MFPLHDLSTADGRDAFEACVHRLRASATAENQWAEEADRIIDAVRRDGDAEIVRQMRRWSDPDFTADGLRVDPATLASAAACLDGPLAAAIDEAIDNVRSYQRHIMPAPPPVVRIGGAALGLRFTPVQRVGMHVPGGTAPLFSTLIMLAVPAQVAGVPVEGLAVASPPPTRKAGEQAGDVSPIVLAVCQRLGVTEVYRMGGPAAFAALALGTQTVRAVDMLTGPSHPIGQTAKSRLNGQVGIDGVYGASEIVTIADGEADPRRVAADLIAQAEHDPGKCFLVSWLGSVIDRVRHEVGRQLPRRRRRAAIETALRDDACAVLCPDRDSAIAAAARLAPEHMNLAVAAPQSMLDDIPHAGEIFLGDATPVAAGDYYAGPSHCLPTGTTARFTSGVSVYTFLRRTGTVAYPDGMPARAIEAIDRMATAEGLDGHAHSARLRGEGGGGSPSG